MEKNRIYTDEFTQKYLDYHEIDLSTFTGDILYLGMGTAYCARNTQANSNTFVEIDSEIVEEYSIDEDWDVYNEDLYMFSTDKKFDIIFVNIFSRYTELEVLQEIKDLYKDNLKEGGKFLFLKKLFPENSL